MISSTPNGREFDYSIELTNSRQSNAGIGTFWFAWVPGQDYLATSPTSVSAPVGWSDQITHAGTGDGYAVQFTADSAAYYVQPGASLGFGFESADTPAEINGNSVFYPGTRVENAFVYPEGPFSDAGHNFVVTPQAATLTSISVTPANPSVPKGETEQFTAIGVFSNDTQENITSEVTWSSATPGVAAISNAAGSDGLATAVAQGTSTIDASLDGVTGSTSFTVNPAVLLSVKLTPVSPTISDNQTEQFTATGTFSDESTLNLTNQADWSSSNTAIVTISTSGLATGVAPGQSTITAAVDGITASTLLAVTSPLVSITVTPANPNIPLGETEQFTATGTLADGATESLTSEVTWASATTSVATVSNVAGSRGLATTQSAGTSNISATFDGITGSTVFTVSPAVLVSIAVTPKALAFVPVRPSSSRRSAPSPITRPRT